MRISPVSLRSRLVTLNMILGRPAHQFTSKVGEPTRFAMGHICLNKDASGWSLEEQTSVHGAVSLLASGFTTRQMDDFLSGMIRGIGLRNIHIGEMLLRAELHKHGLCAADAPLYQEDAARDEAITKYKALTGKSDLADIHFKA